METALPTPCSVVTHIHPQQPCATLFKHRPRPPSLMDRSLLLSQAADGRWQRLSSACSEARTSPHLLIQVYKARHVPGSRFRFRQEQNNRHQLLLNHSRNTVNGNAIVCYNRNSHSDQLHPNNPNFYRNKFTDCNTGFVCGLCLRVLLYVSGRIFGDK